MDNGDNPSPSMRNHIVSGLAWVFFERLATQLVGFAVSVVLARMLSPYDYGIVAIVLVFISLADTFVSSGFSTALIQKKDAADIDFSTMFYCSLCCALLLYAALFFSAPLIASFYDDPNLVLVVRIFSLRVPLSVFGSIQHAYVSRHMLFKRFFWSSLFGTLLSGVVGILLAVSGFGVWALIAQYFTDTIVDALVLGITVPWRPRLVFSLETARQLMSYGWKVLAADLSGTFFGQLRSLIIGRIYTPADLAFYNKGQQIPQLVGSNLSSAIMGVLFPAMSNQSDDLDVVRAMCRRCLQVLSYLISPILFGIAAVAPELVVVLYTDKWLPCCPFLQVLSISFSLGILGVVPLQVLKAIGRSDVVLRLEFLKKPVFVMLLIVGIRINTFAIAITMAAYELYGTLVNSWQLRRYISYSFSAQLSDIAPSFAASTAMAFVVHFLPLSFESPLALLLIKTVIGMLVYLLLSQVLNLKPYRYLLSWLRELRAPQA